MITRRQAIHTAILSGAALSLLSAERSFAADPTPAATATPPPGPFKLPPLGYDYAALEPAIDAETMHLHHDKHHATYVAKLNEALATADPKYSQMTIEELLTGMKDLPEALQKPVRNHGGGHYNHSLFWQMLKKDGGQPSPELTAALGKTFGDEASFWKKFSEAAAKQFGSGWAWLVVTPAKDLAVVSAPNQDTPFSEGSQVLLGLDVWEHAYYLKYRNKRVDYIAAFPGIVNWEFVNARFAKFMA